MHDDADCFHLWYVQHPIGNFIGVARNIHEAREHFGTAAKISAMSELDILNLRAEGPDRVFLAI